VRGFDWLMKTVCLTAKVYANRHIVIRRKIVILTGIPLAAMIGVFRSLPE